MKNWWLSLTLLAFAAVASGETVTGPQFAASGVLTEANGNRVAPLAPGIAMRIRGSGLGPRNACLPGELVSPQRVPPSPFLPNPIGAVDLDYPTTLCGVQVAVGGTPAGLYEVSDREITFIVPRDSAIEGTTELRVTYLGESKAVTLPLGLAVLSIEGVARVGMPVWVHVSLYDRTLQYPFYPKPADFRCNDIEVRKNGKPLPRIATAASQQIGGGMSSGFGPCGTSSYPGATGHKADRIPLHLQYKFDTPGTYEIQFQLDEGWRGKITSAWTPIEIQPATSQDRDAWIADLSSRWPSDPAELVTDALPSVMGVPDAKSLELVMDALYHPDGWVRQYAMGGLTYWPDSQSLPAVMAAVRGRGVDDFALRFLESKTKLTIEDRRGIIESSITDIESSDPVLLRGAVGALRDCVYVPAWQIDAVLRKRVELALIEAAEHVAAAADPQTRYDYAGSLGLIENAGALTGVKDSRTRDILWSFIDRRIALGSAISALSSRRVPADLPRLAQLAIASPVGREQELEIGTVAEDLYRNYRNSALPYLETMVRKSTNPRVRMEGARILIRLGNPAGFAFVVDSIEQDQTDPAGMRGYLRQQFPELRMANDAAV